MSLKIGIDVGSTTVKVVVLDEQDNLLFRSYERHLSMVREKTCELLRRAQPILEGQQVKTVITGSAGLGLAKSAKVDFVQEVFATAEAVERFIPDTDAVIELGGEDAKIIFFQGSLEERMNGSCAGGIDQMATLVGVTADELDQLSLHYEKIYPIASRCGVFAKSDIQPILNQGARKEDVAASIFQAVVDQTVAGLAQGRDITGKVVFLGGPLHFLMGLRQRFQETLKLDDDHAVFPENGDCFAAIGAALCSEGYGVSTYEDVYDRLVKSVEDRGGTQTMPPLFASQAEYDQFIARHNSKKPPEVDAEHYTGKAYLGIDAGSTTTKVCLIDPDGGLLYTYYSSNRGNPVSVILEQLHAIYEKFGSRITIAGSAVTGYGEDLIKSAFQVDAGLVETVAHFRAASHFSPGVDFIIDIGGQDMKCFKIRNNAVDSIMLNEACSSGCGSFIETFAKALGYSIADFSKMGLLAKHPVNLGSRCTVFMNSSVNLGKNIVVQGGTFLNDGVLRAFELELGRNVTRPVIAGLMGAYGAALTARDLGLDKSAILTEEQLKSFAHKSNPTTCKGCTNHCSLTINLFDGGRRFISGNRCSKPLGGKKTEMPDMFHYKYSKLRSMEGKGTGTGARGRMGIPFGLNMYENLPFWHAFFTRLGFEVVLSPESSRGIYLKGQHTIPSDTVCYPAKLLHGHVEALVEAGVDAIWYPCMSYNNDEGIGDNHYNCPVVAYYPELLAANVPALQKTKFLDPYVGLWRHKDCAKRLSELLFTEFGIPKKETKAAVEAAYDAYNAYVEDVHQTGEAYIEQARQEGRPIIVMAGRPYHIDPEINHGINDLITSFGFVLITEDTLAYREGYETRTVLNQWTFQSRMYNAARYVCTQKDMQMVQLVSFGCGTDAITTDELRSILEQGGKLYTQLKIDDITNLGAVKIRIRSLMAAMDARKEAE